MTTRGWPLLGVVVLAVAGAAAGCKDDAPDPAVGYIKDYCDIYKPCCIAVGLPGDGVACEALLTSTRPPGATFSAPSAGHCLSVLRMISSEPGFCEGDVLPPSSCSRVFGPMPEGACIQDADCPPSAEGEVRCIAGGTQTPRCQIQAHGALGSAPCVGDVRGGVVFYSGAMGGDVPDLGYLCDAAELLRCDTAQTGACVALVEVGAPCLLTSDCVATAFCDGGTGLCATRKAIGAPCADPAGECEDAAFCDLTAMACAAKLDVGGYCTEHVQCLTGNCPDGTCQPTPGGGANPVCGG